MREKERERERAKSQETKAENWGLRVKSWEFTTRSLAPTARSAGTGNSALVYLRNYNRDYCTWIPRSMKVCRLFQFSKIFLLVFTLEMFFLCNLDIVLWSCNFYHLSSRTDVYLNSLVIWGETGYRFFHFCKFFRTDIFEILDASMCNRHK